MIRSNCLVWALRQRLRYGGRLLARRSPHAKLPRFVWQTKDGRYWYYGPLFPRRDWRAFFHKVWFRGEVRECDSSGKQLPRRRKKAN